MTPNRKTEIPGSDVNAGQMSCTKAVCLIDPNFGDPIAGDGATWSMVPAAAPSGSSGPQQWAPACVAPSHCYAVGEFTNAKAGTDPLANVLTTVPGS
jgi:hypothetical protein